MSRPSSALPKTLPAAVRRDPLLPKLVGELVARHGCHTVVLYGSRALGTATPESDYDLLGIREGGEPTRDARIVDGFFLDAFIYVENDLEDAGATLLQVHRGLPLLDPRGIGARLVAAVERTLASPPPPVPQAELDARRTWCHKMLGRIRRGGPLDVEAHYRRVWLLVDLLELYFMLRGRHFLGPKRSFEHLRTQDPPVFRAFAEALAPGAPDSAVEALVELVVAG
jgi:hypothetical protein